jgi:membrane-associated phospholipid phosphatase
MSELSTHRRHPVAARLGMLRIRAGWPRQMLLFLTAYLVYSGSRWVIIGDEVTALEHARWIVDLEVELGVAVEASVQQALDGTAFLWLLNHAYIAAQIVVVPAALVWLYKRDAIGYRRLRDTVLATWLLAIPVYWLFPVAPPRLSDLGIADTITQQTGFALDSSLTTSFYNHLAAVPSLHSGFAFAVSLALAASLRRRWTRGLALLWAPTIFLAVVATGNHFVSDIVAGVAITILGFYVARLVTRRWEDEPARRPVLRPALVASGCR